MVGPRSAPTSTAAISQMQSQTITGYLTKPQHLQLQHFAFAYEYTPYSSVPMEPAHIVISSLSSLPVAVSYFPQAPLGPLLPHKPRQRALVDSLRRHHRRRVSPLHYLHQRVQPFSMLFPGMSLICRIFRIPLLKFFSSWVRVCSIIPCPTMVSSETTQYRPDAR